ncbi:MAG: response regulator transcription factor [Lachnospiraceae bacterium]|nr:response regulator transcription factor [Lachnospiraceae bacterium]
MKKILIVEDDTNINNMIHEVLTKQGYECVQAFSGTEGLLYVKQEELLLVLLDLMLPGMPGEALLAEIKARGNTPVIVMSAKDSLDSKVELLTGGAEDYITKPFELEELVARVGVQVRRFAGQGETVGKKPAYKNLVLHEERFSAEVEGRELELTKQEYKILELFLLHPKKVFSKQDIYDYAWEDVYIGEDKTINVHISNIRKKIKNITEDEYIETVWGIGFRLAK